MSVLVAEARKVPAFMRRDLLVMLSYRAAFAGDLFYIGVQAVMFGFVGQLIDASKLPTYGGASATYFDFVMIGVIITTICTVLLQRVAMAVRQEQMIGTLEALLVTPTSATTVQIGSVAFDLVFVPIRMALLLAAVAVTLGLGYEASGILPSLVLLAALVPFVWGLGLMTAAAIVTFRRGTGPLGVIMSVLGLASGAFFPLALLPGWIQSLAQANPVAIAMEDMREALIGGAGWAALGSEVIALVALSGAALGVGVLAFRAALAREHRRGTLGLY
jgi:ABC-2 type transport system permease protein